MTRAQREIELAAQGDARALALIAHHLGKHALLPASAAGTPQVWFRARSPEGDHISLAPQVTPAKKNL